MVFVSELLDVMDWPGSVVFDYGKPYEDYLTDITTMYAPLLKGIKHTVSGSKIQFEGIEGARKYFSIVSRYGDDETTKVSVDGDNLVINVSIR